MLRQLFRTRGAYNVVNLPVAASQDDPGSNPGRADHSLDWRQQSSLAQANDAESLCKNPLPQACSSLEVAVQICHYSTHSMIFECSLTLLLPAVESWQRPNWYTDSTLTSTAAAKILKKRLENFGPQSE